MKKYCSFFRMRFINGLQYRAAALSGIATQLFWGGMEILLFRAFYQSGANEFPMAFHQLSSYIWLQQAFLAFFMPWFWENELFEMITSGNVTYELLRPTSLYHMWFCRTTATRVSKGVLRCLPILLFAAFLPVPYGLSLPISLTAFLLFLISMILGLLVVVAFAMLIYLLAFYMLDTRGIKLTVSSIVDFLSGSIIPLPFFPESLRRIIKLLPFASMQSVPFYIYSGYLSGSEIYWRILLQLFWLGLLVLIGRLLERQLLKATVIQGG